MDEFASMPTSEGNKIGKTWTTQRVQAKQKAWRGCCTMSEFIDTMEKFEFTNKMDVTAITNLVIKMGCYAQKQRIVLYSRLLRNFYRLTPMISLLSGKFVPRVKQVKIKSTF